MDLVPGVNQSNLFWAQGMFGKTQLYILSFLFYPFLFCYLVKQAFSDIKKFRKHLWTFFNLFVGPLYFFRYFTLKLIYGFLL
jgi:hypothetical protein